MDASHSTVDRRVLCDLVLRLVRPWRGRGGGSEERGRKRAWSQPLVQLVVNEETRYDGFA